MIPNPYPGVFIVFEGIDGCGKSTQIKKAAAWLRSFEKPGISGAIIIAVPKFNVCEHKEPGRERFFGKKIYADLTIPDGLHRTNPHGFQAWYACDSKENLSENIIPELRASNIVLCDRFRPSLVYGAQTSGEIPALMAMNQAIIGENFIWPDLILVFDVEIIVAIERLKKKSRNLDEHEKKDVLNRVQDNYLDFAEMYPNCQVVDGEQPEEAVFEDVQKLVTETLFAKKFLTQ